MTAARCEEDALSVVLLCIGYANNTVHFLSRAGVNVSKGGRTSLSALSTHPGPRLEPMSVHFTD